MFINLLTALRLEQRPQLIILDINNQLPAILINEPRDGAHRLLRLPPNPNRIHIEVHLLRHPDDGDH